MVNKDNAHPENKEDNGNNSSSHKRESWECLTEEKKLGKKVSQFVFGDVNQ
jgi:hypothetical protein